MSSYQLLLVLSILGWGLSSLFYKISNNTMHPLMVTTVVTSFYVLVMPLAFVFLKFEHTITFSGTFFAILGAIGACVGSLCYFFAYRAGGGAGEVTALTAVYPAVTLALSCLFLGEPFTFKKGLGISIALLGSIILGWK
jgi:bacterial/archaeal transporter family protein